MKLIPKPNGTVQMYDETYKLKKAEGTIDVGDFSNISIKAFCSRKNFKRTDGTAGRCDITLLKENEFREEEYAITVDENGAILKAASDTGVIYGLTTLYLLMNQTDDIPFCRIHDKPLYSHRGLSLDCARNFVPAAEIKAIIEQMALVKMNTLHLHLTDDQSWRIECRQYPQLHMQHGEQYLSQTDIREIVDLAKSRGIEIVPEIDMPGHLSSLLAVYPQYSCSGQPVKLAAYGGIYPVILCAGNENTYKMIETILNEICELFPAARFHIGGDEAPKKEWKRCQCCQRKMKEEHLENEAQLQGYFSNRVAEMLKKRGKTAICWNDSLMADNLSPQSQIQFWSVQYEDYFEAFAERGGKFIYSDMFTYYLDYPHSMSPLRRVYNDSISIKGVDYAAHPSLLGIEACLWSEHITEASQLEMRLFPRIYAAAEKAWSQELDYEDFKERLRHFLASYHPGGMAYTPETGWDPQGQERQAETFAYLKTMNEGMPEDIRKETVESAAPNKAFEKKFMKSFFEAEDMPFLMKTMGGE